jgi:hypothetical protein
MTRKINVFKFAVNNVDNVTALKDTNIWSFPHGEFPYNLVRKVAVPGDRVIFTHKGSIVGIGEILSMPNGSITAVFPDNKAYTNSFTVFLEKWGTISKEQRMESDITLRPGAISFGDHKTFNFAKKNLQHSR